MDELENNKFRVIITPLVDLISRADDVTSLRSRLENIFYITEYMIFFDKMYVEKGKMHSK
jgi:hypothetical protein